MRTTSPQAGLQARVISHQYDTATVQLTGELDLSNAEVAATALVRAADGRRFVRLDLSGLTFCDVAGLHVIVHAHNQQLAQGRTLILVGLTDLVHRLLAVSHLDEALFIVADNHGSPQMKPPCRHSRSSASGENVVAVNAAARAAAAS